MNPDDYCDDQSEDALALTEHCLDVDGDMWKWELDEEYGF